MTSKAAWGLEELRAHGVEVDKAAEAWKDAQKQAADASKAAGVKEVHVSEAILDKSVELAFTPNACAAIIAGAKSDLKASLKGGK